MPELFRSGMQTGVGAVRRKENRNPGRIGLNPSVGYGDVIVMLLTMSSKNLPQISEICIKFYY